jgi:hypothetical protein
MFVCPHGNVYVADADGKNGKGHQVASSADLIPD